jgi:hypothetical protein
MIRTVCAHVIGIQGPLEGQPWSAVHVQPASRLCSAESAFITDQAALHVMLFYIRLSSSFFRIVSRIHVCDNLIFLLGARQQILSD